MLPNVLDPFVPAAGAVVADVVAVGLRWTRGPSKFVFPVCVFCDCMDLDCVYGFVELCTMLSLELSGMGLLLIGRGRSLEG